MLLSLWFHRHLHSTGFKCIFQDKLLACYIFYKLYWLNKRTFLNRFNVNVFFFKLKFHLPEFEWNGCITAGRKPELITCYRSIFHFLIFQFSSWNCGSIATRKTFTASNKNNHTSALKIVIKFLECVRHWLNCKVLELWLRLASITYLWLNVGNLTLVNWHHISPVFCKNFGWNICAIHSVRLNGHSEHQSSWIMVSTSQSTFLWGGCRSKTFLFQPEFKWSR